MSRARSTGDVALVLHTHVPYVKHQGVWPVGEEWLFQAWGESWLPVTEVLLRLAEDGHRGVLTLGVTPTVAEQLADPRLRRDLGTWLGGQMWQSEEQRTGYGGRDRREIRALAAFHWRRYAALLALHEEVEARGGLLAVWADLESRGVIELLGGPATHPYLPLCPHPDLIDAQLATGLRSHERWAGRRPDGLWAPECGYRPRGPVADPTAEPLDVDPDGTPTLPRSGAEQPGLEEHYARHDISHFLVDAPTFVRAAGGADRDWTVRPAVPDPAASSPDEVVHDAVLVGESDVAAFARDLSVAYHVWSPTSGYPGDPWYRDFHHRGGFGLHPSWRVTDKGSATKSPYQPDRAAAQTAVHAEHLHAVLREVLDPRPGRIVVAAYDTELFGHWWMEGPLWLERVMRRIVDDPALSLTTLRGRLERRPPTRRLALPESSWGYAKGHASWVTPETRGMWRGLRRAEQRFRRAAGAASGSSNHEAALRQAARELACAQASDWPFMVTRGDCPEYAHDRMRAHLQRLDTILDALDQRDAAHHAEITADLARTVDSPRDPGPFLLTSSTAPISG